MSDLNREQFEHWNGPGGQRWVNEQARLDRVLEPLGAAAIAAAAPRTGEQVIDVGCGCGATTLELADRVGATGSVLGVDLSQPMLMRARERAASRPQVRFEQADVTDYAFDGSADLVFSRFGVMFFADPVRAFVNLRRALRRGGRLGLLCWRAVELNPWFEVPCRAAESVLGATPAAPEGAPGPFSFAPEQRTRALLEAAGFANIELRPFDYELELSHSGLDEAVAFAVQAGPVARMLLQVADDPSAIARTTDAIRTAVAAHQHGQRVTLASSVWIITASA